MKLHSNQLNILNRAVPFLIFIVVFFTHNNSPVAHFSDSRWIIYESMSLIKEGNLNLDEYKDLIAKDDYRIRYRDGHIYSQYPIGTPILVTPLVFAIDKIGNHFCNFDFERYLKAVRPTEETILPEIDVFIASCIVALSTVVIFLIGRLFLNTGLSLLLVFIFAFCTQAWSTASRALWQHGPSMLMLSLALYLILLAKKRQYLIIYLGLPLLFASFIRPLNIISAVIFSIYIVLFYRRYAIYYFLFPLCLIGLYLFLIKPAFCYSSFGVYKEYVPHIAKYELKRLTFEPLLGNLLSPSRGLFVFTPVFLFSIAGFAFKSYKRRIENLDYFLMAVIFFHWIAISSIGSEWWGGHSFGPRYFSDMTPYLIYFLIPVFKFISTLRGKGKYLLISGVSLVVLCSFYINYKGATSWKTWQWNVLPKDPYKQPARLWDWRDMQFLR